MNDMNLERNDGIEIDLRRLVNAVMKRLWLVVIAALIGAVVSLVGTLLLITPTYQSSAMFYVNNSNLSVGDVSLSMSSGDLSTSRGLVKSYIVILKTRETLLDVIDYAGVDLKVGQLSSMIKAEAVDNTEIFRVTVTTPDPNQSEQIANAIAYILPKRIGTIIDGTSAKVVDAAVAASRPSSPSYTNNTIIGFALGLMLSVALIVLRELFDVTVRTEEDIASVCDHPVLASVPDMESQSKGGYYGYGQKKAEAEGGKKTATVGSDISFAASEAYKLLRTKLQFSFADEGECRIIGVSSALTGEGKSLSAVNLAHSLSQLNKKVLLIDADMRRPSVFAKLPVQKMPGLSNFLTGQNDLNSLIQPCGLPGEERAFAVISSGRIPPNPMELLNSPRMAKFLSLLRQHYDYVIVDLPPVGEVGDALAVAKSIDGFLLVVRQNYCNRLALKDVVRQFAFVDSKILGVVYNATTEDGSNYGYGKRYYKKYYKDAQSPYEKAGNKARKKAKGGSFQRPKREL